MYVSLILNSEGKVWATCYLLCATCLYASRLTANAAVSSLLSLCRLRVL